MRTFLAILLVAVLALLASSSTGFRLRRSRWTVALFGGGWVAIGVGAAIGPQGLGAVTLQTIQSATPLVVLGLGWIGLMIGLQAQRTVLTSLPPSVVRVCGVDAALTLGVFGLAGWIGLRSWLGADGGALWTMTALLACASLGWTMETRSLSSGDAGDTRERALIVRGSGGLAAILTIAVFGVVYSFAHPAPGTELSALSLGSSRLVIGAALGLAAGLIGRYALREAAGSRGAQLTVVLGLVAIVGGLAFEMDLSSLFVAGATGAVMTNLAGNELRSFERVILKAEHAVAAVFAMLAGALLDPAIGWGGLGLAALLAGLRLIVKPFALRAGGVRREGAGALSWAVVRQSPLAVALGVSVVVSVGDAAPAKLLTVIVLAGVLAELTPLAAAWALRGAPMETPVEPKAAAEGAPESASEQGGAS